jgi:hypothetical protein
VRRRAECTAEGGRHDAAALRFFGFWSGLPAGSPERFRLSSPGPTVSGEAISSSDASLLQTHGP